MSSPKSAFLLAIGLDSMRPAYLNKWGVEVRLDVDCRSTLYSNKKRILSKNEQIAYALKCQFDSLWVIKGKMSSPSLLICF